MKTTLAALVVLLVGCADVRMPNAIMHEQFSIIKENVEEQARERPPETEREAARLTEIRRMSTQGTELARISLKLSGKPDRPVPSPRDYAAVHHETKTFEEDVDADMFWKDAIKPFIPKAGHGLALGGGGVFAIGMSLLKMFTDNRKMKRKDKALGAMFAFAEAHSDKSTRERELALPEVQAEYAGSAFKVDKKVASGVTLGG